MYVCIRMYMNIWIYIHVCMHPYVYEYMSPQHPDRVPVVVKRLRYYTLCKCVYVDVYVCMDIIHVFICMYTFSYIYIYIYIHIFMYVCMYVYICIYMLRPKHFVRDLVMVKKVVRKFVCAMYTCIHVYMPNKVMVKSVSGQPIVSHCHLKNNWEVSTVFNG